MAEEKERRDTLAANDNSVEAGEGDSGKWRKVDELILTVVRALGRQIAREEFARLKALSANDNQSAGDGEDK